MLYVQNNLSELVSEKKFYFIQCMYRVGQKTYYLESW